MNTSMLKDPMLYIGAIIDSFLFGFIESLVGIFNFSINPMEIFIIVLMSIVGIFFSLLFYALLSDAENRFKYDIQRETLETPQGFTVFSNRTERGENSVQG